MIKDILNVLNSGVPTEGSPLMELASGKYSLDKYLDENPLKKLNIKKYRYNGSK